MELRTEKIEGKTFGHLTVIELDHRTKNKTYYRCLCDCGKETVVPRENLRSGKTKSCGHLRGNSANMCRGKGGKKVVLSEKQTNWLMKHFCHTKNDDIKEKLGITDGVLHRFARANGLTKTPQFLKKRQAEMVKAAKESHLKNGTYPPKGYSIPGSEKNYFKPGESNKDRLSPKRFRESIEKTRIHRKERLLYERYLVLTGRPQETKLKVTKQPVGKIKQRCYLKRRGYIIDDSTDTAYYTEETQRSPQIEERTRLVWYKFKHINERI